jgi:hypothetical protein
VSSRTSFVKEKKIHFSTVNRITPTSPQKSQEGGLLKITIIRLLPLAILVFQFHVPLDIGHYIIGAATTEPQNF